MRKIKLILSGVLILSLISGCAGTTRWYLNGSSETQFRQDDAICQSYASQGYSAEGAKYAGQGAGYGSGELAALGGLLTAFELSSVNANYCQCMQSRGYTKAN